MCDVFWKPLGHGVNKTLAYAVAYALLTPPYANSVFGTLLTPMLTPCLRHLTPVRVSAICLRPAYAKHSWAAFGDDYYMQTHANVNKYLWATARFVREPCVQNA